MRKALTLLMVLLVAVSCLAVGTVVAEGPHAGEGPGPGSHKDVEGDLGDIEDFRTGDQHGQKGAKGDLEAGELGQEPPDPGIAQLTNWDDGSIQPLFSPDGTKIAYMLWPYGGNREIWVMELDFDCWPPKVTARYPVTDSDDQCAHLEDWSPDGTEILFRSWYDGLGDYNRLYVAQADGSGVEELKAGVGNSSCFGGPGHQASYSPDEASIVYPMGYYGPDGGWYKDIYVMNADGSGAANVTPLDGTCKQTPRWSPDGSMILYRTCGGNLWVTDADGGNPVLLDNQTGGQVYSWSPDSEWIAYATDSNDVYKIKPDGTGKANLTETADGWCQHDPLWGPDGTILYRSDELIDTTDDSSTWVMRDDGSEKTVAVSTYGGKWHDWGPTGEWIVFQACCGPTSEPQLFIVRNPLFPGDPPPPCRPVPNVPAAGIWGSAAVAVMLAGLLVWTVRRRRMAL